MIAICDNCHYCYVKSNKNKGAMLSTCHYICTNKEQAVNPTGACTEYTERRGKQKIIYKNGDIEDCEWREER